MAVEEALVADATEEGNEELSFGHVLFQSLLVLAAPADDLEMASFPIVVVLVLCILPLFISHDRNKPYSWFCHSNDFEQTGMKCLEFVSDKREKGVMLRICQ